MSGTMSHGPYGVRHRATGSLTRDEILDNITLYWLTNTAISSGRLYWENKLGFLRRQECLHPGCCERPGKQPQLFSEEVRAGFRSLR